MSRIALGTGRPARRLGALNWGLRVGFAFVVFGLIVALFSGSRGGEAHLVRSGTGDHVIVAPGQTLWDIAVAHAPPGSDPRAYLLQLRQANGLDGRAVPAWTVLLLPEPDLPGGRLAPRLRRGVFPQ